MIRTVLDRIRRLLLGPNLLAFARMPRADVHQLLQLGSDEMVFFDKAENRRAVAGANKGSNWGSEAAYKDLEILKQELAALKERIVVLERINYKNLSRPSIVHFDQRAP